MQGTEDFILGGAASDRTFSSELIDNLIVWVYNVHVFV
jgi:hypothetical protein